MVESRKCFTNVMIYITVFLLLSSENVAFVEGVTSIRTYSRKTSKLRNIYTTGRGARNISINKWEINYTQKNN